MIINFTILETFFILFVSDIQNVSYVCCVIMEDVKNEIIEKCCGLFIKYGTKSITMDDIARELSMSKKTIYQHFSDKEDIVRAFVNQFVELQRKHMYEAQSNSENVIDELLKNTEHMKLMLNSMNPSLVFDLKKYHPKCWNVFVDFKSNSVYDFICETIKRGITEGYFRKEINPQILSKMRMEQIELAFNTEIFPVPEFNASNVHIAFFEHFIYGIATIKGHKLLNKYKQITEDEE